MVTKGNRYIAQFLCAVLLGHCVSIIDGGRIMAIRRCFCSYKAVSELILGLRPNNERQRYFVMTSLIVWALTWNQPWVCVCSGGNVISSALYFPKILGKFGHVCFDTMNLGILTKYIFLCHMCSGLWNKCLPYSLGHRFRYVQIKGLIRFLVTILWITW